MHDKWGYPNGLETSIWSTPNTWLKTPWLIVGDQKDSPMWEPC